MELNDIQDLVENTGFKVAFITDFFTQPLRPGETPEFSGSGLSGLCLILRGITDDLDRAVDEIQKTSRKEVRS